MAPEPAVPSFTLALAQMRVWPGRPRKNFQAMQDFIRRAQDSELRFIAFPELCVGGYLLSDRWTSRSFCEELLGYNDELVQLSKGMVLVWGNVWMDPRRLNKDGRERKYNAAFVAVDGAWAPRKTDVLPPGVTFKTLLPNYRMFDDERYFLSLTDLAAEENRPLEDYYAPFEVPRTLGSPSGSIPQGFRFGVQICEDLWYRDYRRAGQGINVTGLQVRGGAQAIVNLSASPWTWGKNEARHRRVTEAFSDEGRGVVFAYVNCTGVQNNGKNLVTFDGGSTVYDGSGAIVTQSAVAYEPELLTVRVATQGRSGPFEVHPPLARSSVSSPQTIPVEKTLAQYRAAVEGIRSLDDLLGSTFPYIIGLSGGVDSAVVACLLVKAVGPDRVKAFNLPSRYNSSATRSVAAQVAASLGCSFQELPIETLVAAHAAVLDPFHPSILNFENIQAKIRGTSILSNLAGILGGVMVNNGNKVEIALGYATLYGDVNGVVAPVGDLTKTEVFALAAYLNQNVFGREIIPRSILPDSNWGFEIAPSAELKEAQRDPMKWGYHDALLNAVCTYSALAPEDLLALYEQDELFSSLDIPAWMVDLYGLRDPVVFVNDLEWFFSAFYRSVFKRIQAPPIIIMSKSAFGYDYRESQLPWEPSRRFEALKTRLLSDGRVSR